MFLVLRFRLKMAPKSAMNFEVGFWEKDWIMGCTYPLMISWLHVLLGERVRLKVGHGA